MVLPANSELFGLLYDSDFYERATPATSFAGQREKGTPMK